MKFQIYLKDPDSVYDSVQTAVSQSLAPLRKELANNSEYDALREKRLESVNGFISKWVEFGEYVMLEFDTDSNSCRVVPVGEVNNEEPNFGYIDSFVKGK